MAWLGVWRNCKCHQHSKIAIRMCKEKGSDYPKVLDLLLVHTPILPAQVIEIPSEIGVDQTCSPWHEARMTSAYGRSSKGMLSTSRREICTRNDDLRVGAEVEAKRVLVVYRDEGIVRSRDEACRIYVQSVCASIST